MPKSNQIWHNRRGKMESLQPRQSAKFNFECIRTLAWHNLLLPNTLSPAKCGQICHVIVCVFIEVLKAACHVKDVSLGKTRLSGSCL